MEKTIQEYRESVKHLADVRSEIPFSNSNPQRAAVVMKNIFRISNNSVKIFTGSLSKDVANQEDYTDELIGFLATGGKVTVAYENDLDDDSDAVKALRELQKLDVLKTRIELIKLNLPEEHTYNHFAIGDESIYRFELDRGSREAIVCFKDSETVKLLSERFDKMLEYKAAV